MSIRDFSSSVHRHHGSRGFTLIEGLVTVAMVSVMAAVVIPAVYTEFEKAKLANCLAELDGMRAMAYSLGDGRYIPTPDEFWEQGYPDAEPGQYYYVVDSEDHNKGHGNDLDFCDEDNPAASKHKGCPGSGVKFVVFCAHDHGKLAKYCYASDQEQPTVVGLDDPDPYKFQKQKDEPQGEQGPPEGKKPKKPKGGKGKK